MNPRTATCPRGQVRRLTCYRGVGVRTARRSDQPHAPEEAPDLVNQVAARPPALLDLGRYPAGDSPSSPSAPTPPATSTPPGTSTAPPAAPGRPSWWRSTTPTGCPCGSS